MGKTDKQLRIFVKALLKYAEKDGHINPGFTKAQIPTIFKGWDELQFNRIHHGTGAGCCVYIGPDRYSININHCHSLQSKLNESRRSVIRLLLTEIGIIVAITLWLLTQAWNQYQVRHKTEKR
jgi:hypothetical protein